VVLDFWLVLRQRGDEIDIDIPPGNPTMAHTRPSQLRSVEFTIGIGLDFRGDAIRLERRVIALIYMLSSLIGIRLDRMTGANPVSDSHLPCSYVISRP
jgi:hypothetical protein